MNNIDQLLDEMEDYIEGSRSTGFRSNKVAIVKDHLLTYVDRLKVSIPEDLKMAKIVLDNEKEIIEKANKKAFEIIEMAKLEAEKILDESILMEQAYERANQIIAHAEENADNILLSANRDAADIRRGALQYSSEMLGEVEGIFDTTLEVAEKNFGDTLDALRYNLNILSNNRRLIARELEPFEEENGGYEMRGEREEFEGDNIEDELPLEYPYEEEYSEGDN